MLVVLLIGPKCAIFAELSGGTYFHLTGKVVVFEMVADGSEKIGHTRSSLNVFVEQCAVCPLAAIDPFRAVSDAPTAHAPSFVQQSVDFDPGSETHGEETPAQETRPIRSAARNRGGVAVGARSRRSQQVPNTWRHRFRGEVWLQALQTLSIVLWNTCLCIACAWVGTLCYSRGNVFADASVATQSDFEFLAGTVLLVHFIYYWIVLSVNSPVLQPLPFLCLRGHENPQATLLFCFGRLVRHTYRVFSVSLLLAVGTLAGLRPAPIGVKRCKLEFYITCVWMHVYVTAITVALRRIFLTETVVGQRKQKQQRAQHRPSGSSSATQFWKVFMRTLPKILVIMLAGLYVHVASKYAITGVWDFVGFTLGSLALKFVVKEVAKHGVLDLKVKDPRSIFVVIGLPTVLIDTQVRIMLQRVQSVNYTVAWTLGMAIFEILTRCSKVCLLKRQLRRKGTHIVDSIIATAEVAPLERKHSNKKGRVRGKGPVVLVSGESLTTLTGLERWKSQMLTVQVAESYANMSAEYIAIECSSSILYFYWDHPKYSLGGYSDTGSASGHWWSYTSTLGIQIVVEMVVDYVSCVLEIGAGVDFQQIRRYRMFLALLFISFAMANVQICAVMYLTVK